MNQALRGNEANFNQIIEKQKIIPKELKDKIESLQEIFNLLFQKWSVKSLYILILKDTIGFGELKKTLGC